MVETPMDLSLSMSMYVVFPSSTHWKGLGIVSDQLQSAEHRQGPGLGLHMAAVSPWKADTWSGADSVHEERVASCHSREQGGSHRLLRACQKDSRVNLKRFHWPKMEQFEPQ